MKKEKIFYQFYKAINACFTPGVDKHSYKKSKETKIKIFSYEDRRNIIKVANQLSKFIENNYPNIEHIKDITDKEIKAFFDQKSLSCTKNTLMNYKYCIKKIEKMIRQELYLKVNYVNNIKIKSYNEYLLRDVELSPEHLEIILENGFKSNSKAVTAIELAALFGCRVSEISKLQGRDIDLDKKLLHIIDSKGKRSRHIKISSKKQLEFCKKIKTDIGEYERVCPLREDSINAYMRRVLLKNNITIYNGKKTGIHAIRKFYAKRNYLENIKETNSKKEAWGQTSLNLGHSSNRKTLIKTYVKY